MSFSDTSTFPSAITFSNGLYKIFQATNSNYNHVFSPEDTAVAIAGSTNVNIIYVHGVPIDWTLISPALGVSRQATIDAIIALNTGAVFGPISVTQGTSPWVTSVSNFPATQPVSGTITANQGTNPWVTLGSATPSVPATADIVGSSRTTTGTLVTIPAGRTFYGAVSLSNSVTVAGNNQPTISISGTGALPSGTIHQIVSVGLALTAITNSNTITNVYIYGGTGGATVTFTQGASGTSTGQIVGRLL